MKNKKYLSLLLACFFLSSSLITSLPADAALQSRFDAMTFTPAVDNSDYFTVYGSQTLKAWQGDLGFYFDYANRPLQFVGLGAIAGQRQSVIDQILIADLYGAIGFTDWFEAGINIPVVLYNWYVSDVAPFPSDHGGGMGDIEIMGKFRLLNNEGKLIGVAIQPHFTLPSGDIVRYQGSGSLTGGLDAIVDFLFHERFSMALNMGYNMRDHVLRNGVDMDDEFEYGLAGNIKFTKNFHGIVEAFGSTVAKDFFSQANSSPFEAGGGVRYKFGESGLAVNVGATAGIQEGVGAPRIRAFTGLQWTSPGKPQECPECPPPAPPPDPRISGGKIVIWGKVFFDTDKTDIKPISLPILDDVVDVMKKNPQVTMVEVQGNCDIRGSDSYNMDLSQRRSESVITYLVGQGIDRARLQPKGFGWHNPIADNKTKEGMSQNRRVEFVIMQGN